MSANTPTRARRSCLTVPGSAPKMLSKAANVDADEVILDLEDSVAPSEKETARQNIIAVLKEQDFGEKTVVLRINPVDGHFVHRDILEVIGTAGHLVDCVMVPKVQDPGQIEFVDHLLRMVEAEAGINHVLGLEAQIEDASGLTNIDDIAYASERLETLILGPGDMAAALGMPSTTLGERDGAYPGDLWHHVLMKILVAARNADLQAIDGPYAKIKDIEGLRSAAELSHALGYDGKWVVHPSQIDLVNSVFTPTQEAFEHAVQLLAVYDEATWKRGTGAVMFGDVMIDEASAKMARVIAQRGEAAGLIIS